MNIVSGRRDGGFQSSPVLSGVRIVLAALLVASVAGCGQNAGKPATRPHVILVTVDTLRADRVGEPTGAEPVMPTVERMAEHGTLFDYAVSPMGTTWPTHASMMSGLYPRYHGLRSNRHTLPEGVPLVAELLQKAGYRTGSFVSFRGMHYAAGLGRGFDALSDRERSPRELGAIRDGRETMDMAFEWLRGLEPDGGPVFLWLHLFEPHTPYELTEYSRRWIDETGYSGLLVDGAERETLMERRLEIVNDPEERQALNVLYDGEVRLVDDYFAELLDALDETDLLDESVVIFTSDHGDSLGENERIGHGPALRQEILDVPLVIRDYRIDSPPRRIEELVGLVDLAPTIADLALDLPLPNVQGRSLVPFVYGDAKRDGSEGDGREYFAEVELRTPDRVGSWYDPDAIAVYTGGLEFFIQDTQPNQVLLPSDQATDPSGTPATDVDETLMAYVQDRVAEYLAGEVEPEEADLDESDVEALRSLGYIQ